MNRFSRLAALGTAIAIVAAGPAYAHAKLLKSNPAANATASGNPRFAAAQAWRMIMPLARPQGEQNPN